MNSPEGSGVRLPHPSGWKFVEGRIAVTRDDKGLVRVEPRPWLDPFPCGTACLRWWGDPERAEALQGWANRALGTLTKHLPLPDGVAFGPGYHGVLLAFVTAAQQRDDLSSLVKTAPLLDVGALTAAGRTSLPLSIRDLDPPPVFTFHDVRGRGDRFAHRVMTALLGEVPHRPRLVVDVDANSVTCDGKTCWPSDVYVRILHELVKAKGRPVSRREMRAADPILSLQNRLDRNIDDLEKDLQIALIHSNKGYSLPDDYLA